MKSSDIDNKKSLVPKYYLYRRIVAAKLFIDEHFRENISLHQLAVTSCFSKFHFCRLFKKIYGISPAAYIKQRRLDEAARLLLLYPDRPVYDICFTVGYISTNTFTNQFKLIHNLSPSQYRMHHRLPHDDQNRSMWPHCFAIRAQLRNIR